MATLQGMELIEKLEDEGGCSEAKKEACRAECGERHIAWTCAHCPERPR